MWKIVDLKNNKFTQINEDAVLSFGNMENCDIRILTTDKKIILYQVFLEGNFIYFIQDKNVNTSAKNFKFNNSNSFYEIINIDHSEDLFCVKPSYIEAQEIYSSPYFSMYLPLIQKELVECKTSETHNFKFSREEVIEKSCKVCDQYFWGEYDVFNKQHRHLFKNLIWVLWAQICEYGLITLALQDEQISEVMVNNSKKIYFEKNGQLFLSPLQFNNENDLLSMIERICSATGRRIDESVPYCDARLKDGSRVHAIIPPLALNGSCLTIRKFPSQEMTPVKLVEMNSISAEMLEFLKKIVIEKKNILISGGTGTGKTTLLNCLSLFIPESERIITIEDSAELKLQQSHVIRLECRNENVEKKGKISMRDLLKNSLRMRPDRIIVGECRGGEALDMLQAMNTGHDGSMTTVHANSAQDALRRLETLVLFAEFDLPSRAIREQITSALQFVVQLTRMSNGRRCVSEIHEIIGTCNSTGNFLTQSIFSMQKY